MFLSCKAIFNVQISTFFTGKIDINKTNSLTLVCACTCGSKLSTNMQWTAISSISNIIHYLRSTGVITSIYGLQSPSPRTFIPANRTRYVVPLSNIVKLTLLAAASFTGCIVLLLMSPTISYSIVQDWIPAVVSELTAGA